jgi:hypothetical protein
MSSYTVVFSGGAFPGCACIVEKNGSMELTIALLPPHESKSCVRRECTKNAVLSEIVAFYVAAAPRTVALVRADGATVVPAGASIDPIETHLREAWGMAPL